MMNSKRVGIISLGCAKNRVNSEQMMFLLREAGYYVTGDTTGVDAVVVNTCGFIESAKTEAIDTILEMAEEKVAGNIGAIVVAGCLPERHRDDILREIPEIDAVAGVGSYDDIVSVVESVTSGGRSESCHDSPRSPVAVFGDINAPLSETKRIISTSHVWAYLKIADGCDNRCAYCCIPSIRGRYRSRPIEAIAREAAELADAGFKELTLVAQDTTAYGLDIYGKRSLSKLLRELEKIENLPWIRLLYLYPDGFDGELVDEIANSDKIVKYLDIPIQHINDDILRSMNRRGTGAEIRDLFIRLRRRIPGVVLRTSLITGLPGEGNKEFNELCSFLREMKIERAGVFAYSPEAGTPAALMKRPDRKTAEHRASAVQAIQSRIMDGFSKSRIGNIEKVLIEQPYGDALLVRSYAEAPEVDGYIRVSGRAQKSANQPQALVNVKITGIEDGEPIGEVMGERG